MQIGTRKSRSGVWCGILGTGLLASAVLAGGPPPQGPAPGRVPQGMRTQAPQRPLVKGAFLGIGVSPVDRALRAQLDLPEGTGLTVAFVEPKGPAEGILQAFDILTKLNDQILVNAEQLAVLVRMHEPGEKVSLEMLRGGKRRKSSVKLGEKELPPLDTMFHDQRIIPMPMPVFPQFNANNPRMMQSQGGGPFQPGHGPPAFQRQPGAGPRRNGERPGMPGGPPMRRGNARNFMPGPPRPGPAFGSRATSVTKTSSGSTGTFTVTENGRTATLMVDPVNGRRLICIAPNGTIAFNGAINTPEEEKRIPAEFRGLLNKIKKNRCRFPVPVQPMQPPAPSL